MASEAIQSLVIDKIVAAFDGDAEKFEAFLVRSSLEMDKLAIESEIRNAQQLQTQSIDGSNAVLAGLQAQMQTIIDEIDAI